MPIGRERRPRRPIMATSGGKRGALRLLALLAIVGVAVYLLMLGALHFLRPDANPVTEPISTYGASGPYGFFFLGIYGVSELLAGLFPLDVGAEATLIGTIHNIVGNLSFFGVPIGMILLSLAMGKDERWRSFRPPALVVAFAVVLTVILTIVGSNIGLFGVTQRIANATQLLWILLVALRLRSISQGPLARQPPRGR